MILSKSCIYGIRSVLFLAINNDRKFISIREISKELGISFHYLTKILQTLNRANILESTKGPKGGVSFKIPPEKLTVYNILSTIDGEEVFEECVLGLPGCSNQNPCSLHDMWFVTKQHLEKGLTDQTIEEMAQKIKEKKIRLYDDKN